MRIKAGNQLSNDARTLGFGSGWSLTESDGDVEVSNGGSLAAAGDVTISADTGATGTGDIIFKAKGLEQLRLKNSAQATWREPTPTSSWIQFQNQAGTQNVLVLQNIAGSPNIAPALMLSGTNGFGPSGQSIQMGIDTGATTPYRDFFIAKVNSDGTVYDTFYIAPNGPLATDVPTVGIGGQPLGGVDGYRLTVWGDSNGTRMGGLKVRHSPANRTVTDGVLNSTTTVTSATANFTAGDLGRFITGTGIPVGTYITAVASTTSVTISQAATATASSVSLTVVVPLVSFQTNGDVPFLQAHFGTGAGAVVMPVTLVGIGSATSASPTATLDISMGGTANASLKLRTASNGSFQILANGTSATVTMGTQNASTLQIQSNATNAIVLTTAQSVVIGKAAITTTATDGFPYIPAAAGTPTGVPTAQSGYAPMYYDTTAHKLWIYDAGWKGVVVA